MNKLRHAVATCRWPGRRAASVALVAAGLGVGMATARAQRPAMMRRVGVLAPSTAAREAQTLRPFFEQMHQLGWIEGATVSYDRVFAEDRHQDLPQLARALVARKPDLIFAPPLPAAMAAQGATTTIPIVFATGTDPVGAGLVKSLAEPGGNATGMLSVIESLAPKNLEILLQIAPNIRRIGLLGDPADPRLGLDRTVLTPLLAKRGIELLVAETSGPQTFEAGVDRLLKARVDVVMTNTSLSFNLRQRLIDHTRGSRVIVVGHRTELAEAGALFSYAAVLADQIRRAANTVDRILRGARPQDLPVQQPTNFELAINRRTARELGIEIPTAILMRAERIIE